MLVNMVFEFVTLLGFVSLAGICIQLGDYLDKNPNIINEILTTILNKGKTCNIRASCQIFIKSFDLIYINNFKHPLISYFLWIFIFILLGFVFYFAICMRLTGASIGTAYTLWASLLFCSAMFIFLIFPIMDFQVSMCGYNYLFDELKLIIKKEKKLSDVAYGENKVRQVPILNSSYNLLLLIKNARNIIKNTSLEDYPGRSSLLKGLFMSICISASAGILMMAMGLFVRLAPTKYILAGSSFTDMGLFHMEFLKFFSIMILLSFFVSIIFFIPSLYTYIFLYLMEKHRLSSRVSPITVMLSSIVAILIFSMFKPDLIIPFITNRQKFTYEFLLLLLLNVITGSFSIIETRYMLSKAVSASSAKLMILYLGLDFLASSLIYFAIPTLTGDLRLFLDAMFFKGKMAWVGIFYWSNLFTSLFLYIYIISFIILTLLYKFSNVKHIAERPSYSLGWITAVLFVIIYPLYIWSKIMISHIVPIMTLILLFFLIIKVIKKASTE